MSAYCPLCTIDYHDFANRDLQWVIQRLLKDQQSCPGPKANFAIKLHDAVEACSASNLSCILCWLPHGRAFMILDRLRFVNEVLPQFFQSQGTYSSFHRQLNMYGFIKLSGRHGDKGAYYHEYFLRGRSALSELISRQNKGTSKAVQLHRLDPRSEPDFYRMPYALAPSIPGSDVVTTQRAVARRNIWLSEPNSTDNAEVASARELQLCIPPWSKSMPNGAAYNSTEFLDKRQVDRSGSRTLMPRAPIGSNDQWAMNGDRDSMEDDDLPERSVSSLDRPECHSQIEDYSSCGAPTKPTLLNSSSDLMFRDKDIPDWILVETRERNLAPSEDMRCNALETKQSPHKQHAIRSPFAHQSAARRHESHAGSFRDRTVVTAMERHPLASIRLDELHRVQETHLLIDNMGIVMSLEDALAPCDRNTYRLLF